MRSLGAAGYQVCHLVRRLQTAHLELEHVLDVRERSSESFLKVPAHGSAFRCSADGLCVPTGNARAIFYEPFLLSHEEGRAQCEAVRPRPHSAPAYSRRVKANARQCRGPPALMGERSGSVVGPASRCRHVSEVASPRWVTQSIAKHGPGT